MENYLVEANHLLVIEQAVEYNFLAEMYPIINEYYNKLWFYENLATMNSELKEKRISELKNYISQLLEIYHIPENILFVKIQDNKYLEPISKKEFRIKKKVNLQNISEEEAKNYIKLNKDNNALIHDMDNFKELTKVRYKKR